jgi:hypothetical protein
MAGEIEIKKLKDEYPDFFRRTPSEIIDFIFSKKTSEKIADIAMKNGINDSEKIEGIAYRIVWVLLGKLPSGNLAMTLELGVGLAPEIARKIASEANQFIFAAKPKPKLEETALPKKEISTEKAATEKPQKPSKPDVYREPVE